MNTPGRNLSSVRAVITFFRLIGGKEKRDGTSCSGRIDISISRAVNGSKVAKSFIEREIKRNPKFLVYYRQTVSNPDLAIRQSLAAHHPALRRLGDRAVVQICLHIYAPAVSLYV